jgi:hypothetical protein
MTNISRNELCPCGSLKKYKNCCLKKQHEMQQIELNNFDKWFEEDCKIGAENLTIGIQQGYIIE